MRPNNEEVLRGVVTSLMAHVMPELQTPYARTQLGLSAALLSVVANELDGAAQRLADDNAAWRALAGSAAGDPVAEAMRDELLALVAEHDPSMRLSDLRAANERLRKAVGRLGTLLVNDETSSMRAEVIAALRQDSIARTVPLMGTRADG